MNVKTRDDDRTIEPGVATAEVTDDLGNAGSAARPTPIF